MDWPRGSKAGEEEKTKLTAEGYTGMATKAQWSGQKRMEQCNAHVSALCSAHALLSLRTDKPKDTKEWSSRRICLCREDKTEASKNERKKGGKKGGEMGDQLNEWSPAAAVVVSTSFNFCFCFCFQLFSCPVSFVSLNLAFGTLRASPDWLDDGMEDKRRKKRQHSDSRLSDSDEGSRRRV